MYVNVLGRWRLLEAFPAHHRSQSLNNRTVPEPSWELAKLLLSVSDPRARFLIFTCFPTIDPTIVEIAWFEHKRGLSHRQAEREESRKPLGTFLQAVLPLQTGGIVM